MSLAEELLAQARFLANLDPHRPVQANLRRAVSSAYYAVFHLLSDAVADQVSPIGPPGLRTRTRRVLQHKSMYTAAAVFSKAGKESPKLPTDISLPEPISTELIAIADGFLQLQDERNTADYDVSQPFDRIKTLALIETAEDIFIKWSREKTSGNAPVFLASLIFSQHWNKK